MHNFILYKPLLVFIFLISTLHVRFTYAIKYFLPTYLDGDVRHPAARPPHVRHVRRQQHGNRRRPTTTRQDAVRRHVSPSCVRALVHRRGNGRDRVLTGRVDTQRPARRVSAVPGRAGHDRLRTTSREAKQGTNGVNWSPKVENTLVLNL